MSIRTCAKIVAALLLVFLLVGLRYVVPGKVGDVEFVPGQHQTLVVFGPSLGGRASTPDLEKLVRASFPNSDFLIANYSNYWFSNSSPFEMASLIEKSIRSAHERHNYSNIVLFGYSTGGLLLRKAYVWGHGYDSDRPIPATQHPWVDRVERFVSLAAPNRGWPNAKPKNMWGYQYAFVYLGGAFARLTGTGQVALELLQGSRFVANMRVQWIDLMRARGDKAPLVVHLIGGKDELVDREDSIDIQAGAAERVVIKTLDGLNHVEIATGIYKAGATHELTSVGETITMALTRKRDEFPQYWPDKTGLLQTDPDIKQLIFVMHGIRDESNWPLDIKRAIEKQIGEQSKAVKVQPPQYRRFTMLPFLLYWDRQENVRWFMDQYTEAKALYPNIEYVDFVGHSNGTYILASALQQYSVLKVRNVFFAGSVVPIHYDWKKRVNDKQVTGKIWNICADFDWVVAIFPQLFQQISDWMKEEHPHTGLLDIGSAGFRGFRADVGTEASLRNVRYIVGEHGAAFETAKAERLAAIVDFMTSGDERKLEALKETDDPSAWLAHLSNLSWAIWAIGLSVIVSIGVWTYQRGFRWFAIYVLLILGIVTTV